jgi:hypothetical protein
MLLLIRHLRGRRKAGNEIRRLGAGRVAFTAPNTFLKVRFLVDQYIREFVWVYSNAIRIK